MVRISSNIEKGRIVKNDNRYWKIVEIITENDARITADNLSSFIDDDSINIAPVFGDKEKYYATSEFFLVKIKKSDNYDELKQFANNNNCTIIRSIDYMPKWFLLKSSVASNGLEMSNLFYETGFFEDVDPSFIFNYSPSYVPSDSNFSDQWDMSAIHMQDTWNITKGNSNVIVAVIDQGIDQTNREFSSNYSSQSYDLISSSSPSVARGDHGTHVGGVIGAGHNGIQIAGIAPQTTLLSISHSLQSSPTISSELASGFGYATTHGAAVINNSWGDQGGKLYGQLHSAILEDAIKNAINNGRNGKGAVVVFASGNYNISNADYPGNFTPEILVVGSTDNNNRRSSFSSYGNCLDVVAPGRNILSTIRGNQLEIMSGTSMAAPHVTALASLIISLNPELTGKEVVNLIEKTSQKIGGYSYATNTNHTNGLWNNEMGYGLINAYHAIAGIKQFKNEIVTTDFNIYGSDIITNDVTVTNSSKLNLSFSNTVSITKPFILEKGSQIEIGMSSK